MSVAVKKDRAARRVYLMAVNLIDPATGEVRLALVPRFSTDLRLLEDRGIRPGSVLRADLSRPRNLVRWRRAHLLGGLVRESIEGFEQCDSHQAIKKLQLDSGVFCDEERIDIPGLGILLRRTPRTLAFDEMEEGEFSQFWRGLCSYLAATHWPGLSEEQIAQMAEFMPQEP